MTHRKILAVTVFVLALLAAACNGGDAIPAAGPDEEQTAQADGADDTEAPADDAEPVGEAVTLRVGNIYVEDTTYGEALNGFKDQVESESDGSITVEVFHGGTLGSEQDHIEAVREGSLEMMETGTAGIALFVPETALFELWYAYEDIDTLVQAFEDLTPDLDELYQAQGFKLLGAFYDGPRNILSKQPLRTLADVQGLQFRVPGSDLYVGTANALGAQAVTIPLGDVYTGLQTGTIDAMEGTPDSVFQAGFYEEAGYYNLDAHVFQPLSIVYNLDAWEALSPEQQEIVQNAVTDASESHLALVQDANDAAIAAMEDAGLEIVELEDREAWAEAVSDFNAEFAAQFGETGQMILDAMEAAAGQ